MATNPQPSCWQLAARKKFPRAAIQSDGPFAFWSCCSQQPVVRLCWMAAEAIQAQYENCGHAFCKGQPCHSAYQLTPAYPVQQVVREGYRD